MVPIIIFTFRQIRFILCTLCFPQISITIKFTWFHENNKKKKR